MAGPITLTREAFQKTAAARKPGASQRALERSLQYGIDPGAGSRNAVTSSIGRLTEMPISSAAIEELLGRKQQGAPRRKPILDF